MTRPAAPRRALSTRALLCGLGPMLLPLCASAPPAQGVEVRAALGGGAYEYSSGGCGTTSYVNRAYEARAHSQVSYRHSSGLSASLDANLSYGVTTSSTPQSPGEQADPSDEGYRQGRRQLHQALALRPGWHGAWGGAEAGVFLSSHEPGRPDQTTSLSIQPSARLWVGSPRHVYAWGEALAGVHAPGYLGVGAGLGHASSSLRLQVGVAGNQAAMLAGQRRVGSNLWLGATLHAGIAQDASNLGGMLTLSLLPELGL